VNLTLGKLIAALEPGKNFIGLWVYRQHSFRKRKPLWTCTWFDDRGEYWEAPLQKTPLAAARKALAILKEQRSRAKEKANGKKV